MAMRFEHEFTVPVPLEQAWSVLLDVERVAPCLPGATLESVQDDEFTGKIRVRVGPITVTYRGSAKFAEIDKDAYKVTIEGSGKEARGSGTATGSVRAELHDAGEETRVTIRTTFNVTGRPAQFGRGVMVEVGTKLINKFAAALADQFRVSEGAEHVAAPAQQGEEPAQQGEEQKEGGSEQDGPRHLAAVPPPREAESGSPSYARAGSAEDEALDLLEVAGVPVIKRVAPILAAIAFVVALGWFLRRRRRSP